MSQAARRVTELPSNCHKRVTPRGQTPSHANRGAGMNELPNPMLPLSPATLPRGSLHRPDQAVAEAGRRGVMVSWAQHADEVREAQRLRFEVFATEMGARLDTWLPGHDIDVFDEYCEHLLVRD